MQNMENMEQDHHAPAVHFLRRKLDDTRRSLEEACAALQVLYPTAPTANPFPTTNDLVVTAHAHASADSRTRHGASLNFRTEPVLPPIVPAPSIFCLDIIEMEGSVRAQLIAQRLLPLESQSRCVRPRPIPEWIVFLQ
jgi:hypothetical protein